MTLLELIRSRTELRGALAVPTIVVFIFAFFNLTSAVDQQQVMASLQVGLVNLDEGAPAPDGAVLRIGEQVVAGLARGLPFGFAPITDENTARKALDDGAITAALILPPDFSRMAASGATARVRILYSDHLSGLETQFGRSLGAQLQGGLALAVLSIRAAATQAGAGPGANAGPPQPPVAVEAEALHAAVDPLLLQVPFVLGFAGWMGALIGSILLFRGTQTVLNRETVAVVAAARVAIPLAAAFLAALMAALIVGGLTGIWGNFFELWGFRWLVSAASMSLIVALFAWLGYFALLVAVPIVFYQGLASGLLAPAAAAPDWITWINSVIPLPEIAQGMRTILIGGPEGSVPWGSSVTMLVITLALIWAGTMVWARWRPAAAGEA